MEGWMDGWMTDRCETSKLNTYENPIRLGIGQRVGEQSSIFSFNKLTVCLQEFNPQHIFLEVLVDSQNDILNAQTTFFCFCSIMAAIILKICRAV